MARTRLGFQKFALDRALDEFVDAVEAAVERDGGEVRLERATLDDATTRCLVTLRTARYVIEVALAEQDGQTRVVDAALRWSRVERFTWLALVLFPLSLLLHATAPLFLALWLVIMLVSRGLSPEVFIRLEPPTERVDELLALFGVARSVPLIYRSAAALRSVSPPKLEQQRARLRASPRVSLAEHAAGEGGKVVGRVCRDRAVLRAPASGRACVHYELELYESRWTMEDETELWSEWLRVAVFRQREPFLIEDETGRARVEPAGATIAVEQDFFHECSWPDIPRDVWALLEGHSALSRHEHSLRTKRPERYRLRIAEGVFEEGEELAALGRWIEELDPEEPEGLGGYRRQPASRRCLVHARDSPLVLSDRPEDR